MKAVIVILFIVHVAYLHAFEGSIPEEHLDAQDMQDEEFEEFDTLLQAQASKRPGYFIVSNQRIRSFAKWATHKGAKFLTGDFNGDGKTDAALVGGQGWKTIPVAFSNGKGTFRVVNHEVKEFPGWAGRRGAQCVTGDFNGDRKADIACGGTKGWSTLPIAFSKGNGQFHVTNHRIKNFAFWATVSGAMLLAGDFNGDGRTDAALVGGKKWRSIPVALSNGKGKFHVVNHPVKHFGQWSGTRDAQCFAGDFNGDRKADIACEGARGWATLPVAFGRGNGKFDVTNHRIKNFARWATVKGVQVLAGDFNGDGRTDAALVGGKGWRTIPVAFSNGHGHFRVVNHQVSHFTAWATEKGAKCVTGDFNGDKKADIACEGAKGWKTLPIAFGPYIKVKAAHPDMMHGHYHDNIQHHVQKALHGKRAKIRKHLSKTKRGAKGQDPGHPGGVSWMHRARLLHPKQKGGKSQTKKGGRSRTKKGGKSQTKKGGKSQTKKRGKGALHQLTKHVKGIKKHVKHIAKHLSRKLKKQAKRVVHRVTKHVKRITKHLSKKAWAKERVQIRSKSQKKKQAKSSIQRFIRMEVKHIKNHAKHAFQSYLKKNKHSTKNQIKMQGNSIDHYISNISKQAKRIKHHLTKRVKGMKKHVKRTAHLRKHVKFIKKHVKRVTKHLRKHAKGMKKHVKRIAKHLSPKLHIGLSKQIKRIARHVGEKFHRHHGSKFLKKLHTFHAKTLMRKLFAKKKKAGKAKPTKKFHLKRTLFAKKKAGITKNTKKTKKMGKSTKKHIARRVKQSAQKVSKPRGSFFVRRRRGAIRRRRFSRRRRRFSRRRRRRRRGRL